MINTITLNPSIDKFVSVRKLIKDDTLRAHMLHQDPGGKGINVSKVLKELGGATTAFGFIGGNPGRMLAEYMADRDIPFKYVEIEQETRINLVISDLSDRSQTRISVEGPHVRPSDIGRLMGIIKRVRPKPKFWVMGGSVAPGLPKDVYYDLIRTLQSDEIPCMLDADDQALEFGVKAKPAMIKPNEFEMQRLMGARLNDMNDYVDAAQEMVARGIKIVALSLGRKGMIVASRGRTIYLKGPKVEAKSKVGAGDSTVAGMVFALHSGKSLDEAAKLAVAAGTAAVLTEGTRLCCRVDVYRILPKVTLKEIPRRVAFGLGHSARKKAQREKP